MHVRSFRFLEVFNMIHYQNFFEAAWFGQTKAVELLLQYGADPFRRCRRNRHIALDLADYRKQD